jgi:hypothetical protein
MKYNIPNSLINTGVLCCILYRVKFLYSIEKTNKRLLKYAVLYDRLCKKDFTMKHKYVILP